MIDVIFSWETLRWLMWLLYFPVCVFLMVIVLLQKGKGTSFAGAFGIGPGSEAVFGPRASRSLPVRLTYISAALFLILALGLSAVEGKVGKGRAPEKVLEEAVENPPENSPLTDMGLGSAYETKPSEPVSVDTNTPQRPEQNEQEADQASTEQSTSSVSPAQPVQQLEIVPLPTTSTENQAPSPSSSGEDE